MGHLPAVLALYKHIYKDKNSCIALKNEDPCTLLHIHVWCMCVCMRARRDCRNTTLLSIALVISWCVCFGKDCHCDKNTKFSIDFKNTFWLHQIGERARNRYTHTQNTHIRGEMGRGRKRRERK